jgi:pimeloyl-ACP methyl ester carboxylesterase
MKRRLLNNVGRLSAVTLCLGLCLAEVTAAEAASGQPPVRCEKVAFPVSVTPAQPASATLTGWLCARGTVHHKTIQVLIHGATHDHNYFDFPYQPERYSYVNYMTAAGYAVLNLDRIGYGQSTRPANGLTIDLHTAAYNVHEIVQTLRSGNLVVPSFGRVRAERVQLVGFSLGAFISTIEASTYQDVDGVILASYSHTPGPAAFLTQVLSYDASLDPKFAPLQLTNYLTTTPGDRPALYHYLPNMDPAVVALDEQLKEVVTVGENLDIFPSLAASLGVRVPTLVVVGDYDLIACQAPSCTATNSLANEPSFYAPEACVEVKVIPNAGHSLNLHLNAQDAFAVQREWSDRRVGASTKRPAPQPCQ